jgi:transposase
MMGQHSRSEALFYYFRLEDQVPETHLLRLIEKHISLAFVREKLKESYSETGRPSIDPELLLRILLIGYLYGITSKRKLVEELRMHLACRWFTGLGFDQEIPHHSTFSKNRHGRFQESKLFEQLFEEIVARCLESGRVRGDDLSVDGSFVEANASKESRIPREQLAEAAQVNQTVRYYLVELEQQNPSEEPVHQQDRVSTTDPDATYATKGGTPAPAGLLRQLLGGQSQLCDCGCASDGGAHEPGDSGRTRYDRSFRRMARTRSRVRGRRCHLRQRRVPAVVNGAGDHTVYADSGQRSSQEQPTLRSRAFHLSSRKQQLSLSRRSATQLRRFECQESNPCLHRKPQTLRCAEARKEPDRELRLSRLVSGAQPKAVRHRGELRG